MLRDVSEQTSRDLQDHIDGFRRRKDAVKRQVAQLSSKYDQKKAALVDNDTAKQLENLEQKMRHYEQNIFQLSEFVQTKMMQTDFRALKDECGRLVGDVNVAVIQKTQDGGFTMPPGEGVYA